MTRVRRSPLHAPVARAGARFGARHGWEVALGYGEVAAELAACRASAGIADRSHVAKLELRGPGAAVAVALTNGAPAPAPGSAVLHDGTWWCRLAETWAFAVRTRAAAPLTGERLALAVAVESGTVADVTAELAAIELVGPRARDVLARVAGLEVPLASLPVGGFTAGSLARVRGMLLCEGPGRFLALCPAGEAERVWAGLSEAGRVLGAAHVGEDALERLGASRPPAGDT